MGHVSFIQRCLRIVTLQVTKTLDNAVIIIKVLETPGLAEFEISL